MSKILIAAGIGGTLPTLCRIAAAYGTGGDPPHSLGVCAAVGLFFIIGMAVAFGLGESEAKKAFVLGIAAPAIVTSTYNSVEQGKVATAPVANPPIARRLDPPTGFLALLIGVSDANAQPISPPPASASAPQEGARLHVTSNVTTSGGYPIDPLEVRFLSASGVVLASAVVDPRAASNVAVPSGARSVVAAINGQSATTQLPSTPFNSANLKVNIDTSHVSDFLWALGSNRRVRIEGVKASLDSVVQATPP